MTTGQDHNVLIKTVRNKISATLAEQIAPVMFVEWYENWFLDEVENSEGLLDKEIFLMLQELYVDVAYFESHDEIRKEHSSYYGSDELRNKLNILLSTIEKKWNETEP